MIRTEPLTRRIQPHQSPRGAAPKPSTPKQETKAAPEPEEDKDNLQSHSFARVIDLLCEGEVEGLCTRSGRTIETRAQFGKGIYLDETPLLNPNGKPNFRGITTAMQYGTADQTTLPGFSKAEDVIFVGQEVKNGFPVVQSITNPDAETIEVGIKIPSLVTQESNGDVKGGEVSYRVDISLNGGGYTLGPNVTVKGKASNPYVHTRQYVLPHSGTPESDNWQIRVVRLSPDSSTIRVTNGTIFEYITLLTRNAYRYPHSCIVAAEIDASGLTSIPQRGYHLKGLIVKVPSNYFPGDRDQHPSYNRDSITGDPIVDMDGEPVEQPWDGTFYPAWCSNPAWCIYDLLTSNRYGLGDYLPPANVDKWSLYEIGRYCDQLVDDGFGNLEPRFAINCYIQGREEAWKVVGDFFSVFHGMPYWASGAVQTAIDRPQDPIATFTNGNVIDGVFQYSGTAKKARHTTAAVRWNDPDDFYRSKFEYVDEPSAVARYGVNEVTLAAFGCTSRGQAHRMGKWLLLSELYLTDTCSFTTGTEGAYLRPGDIVAVQDNSRNIASHGGRVLSIAVDRLSMTLDRQVPLVSGSNFVSVSRARANLNPGEVGDSTEIDQLRTAQFDKLETTSGAGTTNVLTFAAPLGAEILPGAVWLLENDTTEAATFRVMGVEELEAGTRYQVTAIQYLKDKFDAIDTGLELEEPDFGVSNPNPEGIPHVNALTLTKRAVITPEAVTTYIDASWQAPEGVLVESFKVEIRREGESENWRTVEETRLPQSSIETFVAGTYEVGITVIATTGQHSETLIETILVENVNPLEGYLVSGLILQDQPAETEFTGRDARFEWRLNSPNTSQEIGSEDYGANTGTADPMFKDFLVEVWTADGATLLYSETTTELFWTFLWEKNALTPSGPHNQFKVQVTGRDRYNNATPPAYLIVTNAVPDAPTGLSITGGFRSAQLTWVNPDEIDLEAIEVWEHTADVFASASKIAELAPEVNSFTRTGLATGSTHYYWVRARDTFGNLSTREPSGAGSVVTMGSVSATDLADFAITATKLFVKTIILQADTWTDNSPAAGSIAWNAHTLVYNGTAYSIPAGNTSQAFVYWNPASPTAYATSNANPLSLTGGRDLFQVATNTAGTYDLAWIGIANAVIGSAHIMDLAVTSAKIASLVADKITAGTITSQDIQVAGGAAGKLRSSNYVAGSAGWKVDGAGSAEFNDVTVRGTMDAGTINSNSDLQNRDFPGKTFRSVMTGTLTGFGLQDFSNGGGPQHIFEGSTIPFPGVKSILTALVDYGFGATGICLPGCTSTTQNDYNRVSVEDPEIFLTLACTSHTGEMSIVIRRYPEGATTNQKLFDYAWRVPAVLGDPLVPIAAAAKQYATVFNPASYYGDTPTAAIQILTASANAANGDTVTIDGKTYTFQTTLTNVNGNVKIGASSTATLANLAAAIILGAGSGTAYAAATTAHATVTATSSGAVLKITAQTTGTGANAIQVTETSANLSWLDTLTTPARMFGGRSPGASDIVEIALTGVDSVGAAPASQSVTDPVLTFQAFNF